MTNKQMAALRKQITSILTMVNDVRPTNLAGFVGFLSASDIRMMSTLRDMGRIVWSPDGHYFAPELCTRA
jgi:hypothetical protein